MNLTWIEAVTHSQTPNGVFYTENTHGPHGAEFILFPLPNQTFDDMQKAKAFIYRQKDVVKLRVANETDWDDRFKAAYFRDPRVKPLKWYQVHQDDKIIRKQRHKGLTPTEFVDQFVLPNIGKTEDEMRAKYGTKIYSY